ncbi:transcriptional coactivator YAP1 isoform X1 [Oryzias melastigma]|uniref:Transcriptional coactivator YAP1-like n=2 Tax=Oryzias melastigma TaxID=30732 RepID=A0A3B3DUB5_ORYME|nr:transcriptional coactivator YAP1 isoform X1 [Oryzias melastigma]
MDAHRSGRQVVHVRGDSQKELEALFSRVMNPSEASRQPSSVPMRMRKLPDSFFKPPEPRGHSRQASSDGGVCGSLTPHHSRTVSAPAALPVNSLATQAADVAATSIIPDDVPLPHGWEMAKTPTGQRYFLNHLDKTTTWLDPRLSQLQSAQQHPISTAPVHSHSFSNPAPTTPAQSINPEPGPLPEGWEQAVTPEGEMYYIDHINKTTTWVDPRLAQKMSPGVLSLAMQRQEKLRCKQGAPPQVTQQEAAGRNQMSAGMDHDRSGQVLVPSVDARIRAPNHETALNGAHSRNESTDSGLSVSSLPRTNDHMLSPVDHMDIGDSSDPPSMALQEPMLPMSEGEELMPCIPEGLSSDLLMDMETVLSGSHMDRDNLLTWL